MTLALVPMKDLGEAKQRLSNLLDEPERMGLVYAMLRDVITALRAATNVDEIAIVAHDRGYLDFGVNFVEHYELVFALPGQLFHPRGEVPEVRPLL